MSNDIKSELRKLIQWSRDSIPEMESSMNRYADEENYVKAAEMKAAKGIHESFMLKIQRVVQGKTAFDEDPPKSEFLLGGA